jgi:hypothetical protein
MRSKQPTERKPVTRAELDKLYEQYAASGKQISTVPPGVGGYTQAQRNAIYSGRKTAEQIAAEKADKLFGPKA